MGRDLLKRELEAVNISPKSRWRHPKDIFENFHIGELVRLFETSDIFGEYYQNAVKNKFSLKGRISIVNAQYFYNIGGPSGSLGMTDKKKGLAFLIEVHKRQISTIEAALHEAIHLISHPLRGANDQDMTFAKKFGYPLMEAVTQYFTRIMMIEAGIKNWKTNVYQKEIDNYLKPFFQVFTLLRIDIQKRLRILCELVFKDNVNLFRNCIKQQLLVVNSALSELDNWVNKIYLLISRKKVKKAVNLTEYLIQKDYNRANLIFSESLR